MQLQNHEREKELNFNNMKLVSTISYESALWTCETRFPSCLLKEFKMKNYEI
jgi:hypothetical protein